jgi:hypothetical protein
MLKIFKSALIGGYLFLSVCVFLTVSAYGLGEVLKINQLSLIIEADKRVYQIEEPIIVNCQINNLSPVEIFLLQMLFESLQIYLRNEDEGQEYRLRPIIHLFEIIEKEEVIHLKPHSSFSFQRTINKRFYSMPKKIGKCQLYAIYGNKMEQLGGIHCGLVN